MGHDRVRDRSRALVDVGDRDADVGDGLERIRSVHRLALAGERAGQGRDDGVEVDVRPRMRVTERVKARGRNEDIQAAVRIGVARRSDYR
jgi:hypothetical protein